MQNITSIIFNSVKFSILLDDNNEVVLIPFKPTSPIIPKYNTYHPLPSVPISVDTGFGVLNLGCHEYEFNKTEFLSEWGYWPSNKIDLQHAVSYSYLSDYPHCHIQFKQGCDWGNDNEPIHENFKDELYYFARQKFEVIHFNGSHFNKFVAKVFDEIRMAVSDLADMGVYDVVKKFNNKNWDKLAYEAVIKFYDDFGFNRWAGLETGNTPPCGGHQDANKGGGGRAGLSHLTPLTTMLQQNTCVIGLAQYDNDVKVIRRKVGKQTQKDSLQPFNRNLPNPQLRVENATIIGNYEDIQGGEIVGDFDKLKSQSPIETKIMNLLTLQYNVRMARNNLKLAQTVLRRATKRLETAKRGIDKAQLQFNEAKGRVKSCLDDLDLAKTKLSEFTKDKPQKPKKARVRKEFSYKSREKLRFISQNTKVIFKSMLTLTYPTLFPTNGAVAKRHLNTFFKALKRFLATYGATIEYLWFAEFQKRNAVHFHILLDFDMAQYGEMETRKSYHADGSFKRKFQTVLQFQNWALSYWAGIVKTPLDSHDKYGNPIIWQPIEEGLKRHDVSGVTWEVIQNEDGAKRYVTKYAKKMQQKVVPPGYENVGNFWFASEGVMKFKPKKQYFGTEQDIREVMKITKVHESVQNKQFLPTVLYGMGKNMTDTDSSLWQHHFLTLSDLRYSKSNGFVNFSKEELLDLIADSEGNDKEIKYKVVFRGSHQQTDIRQITLYDISQAKLRLAGFWGYPTIEPEQIDIDELLEKYELEHDKRERWWLYVQKLLDNGLSFNNAFSALGLDWRAKALYFCLFCDMDIVEAKHTALLDEFQIEENYKSSLAELLQNEDYVSPFNRAMTELLEIVK